MAPFRIPTSTVPLPFKVSSLRPTSTPSSYVISLRLSLSSSSLASASRTSVKRLLFVNVTVGPKEDRMMMTGLHTVADIFCVGCGSIVGWKYEAAHDKSQRYKEGKFILERFKVSGPDGSNYWASQEAQVGGSDADDA